MRLLRVLSLSLQAKHGPRLAACVDGERGGVQLMPTKIGLNSLCNLEQCRPKILEAAFAADVLNHTRVLTSMVAVYQVRSSRISTVAERGSSVCYLTVAQSLYSN